MKSSNAFGFTLAELLIAVAIMGLIAAFTVPKIINANNTSEMHRSYAREAAAELANAYIRYRMDHPALGSTRVSDLTPYINIVKIDSTSTVDYMPPAPSTYTISCADPLMWHCYQLRNGGYLWSGPLLYFGGTGTTNAIFFGYDPDGKVTPNTTNGPGKSIIFWLYYDGAIKTYGTLRPHTLTSGSTGLNEPEPTYDPSWWTMD